jgi:hypothetical protein
MPAKKARSLSMLEVGSWNSLPHYAVVGRATDFYLFYRPDPFTAKTTVWITGKEAFELHAKFKAAKVKSKAEFISLFEEQFNKRPKM